MTDLLSGSASPARGSGQRSGVRPDATPAGRGGEHVYDLTDRYRRDEGAVFLSGVQALARVPLEQIRADRLAGLRTGAFVCGYPGSPLAGFDKEVALVSQLAGDLTFVAQPGLNEELAATAVMGSQLAMEVGGATHDGVVGIWYGKAPGLDRACDAMRHANFAGTSRYGGVVAFVGDDPAAKSSTLPSSSDATLVDLKIPVLYPGDVQEAIDLGRHAISLSRACGLWASLKVVAGVADGTGTIELHPERIRPVMPTMEVNGTRFVPHPSGRLLTPYTLDLEKEHNEVRLELARRYAVENRLNEITVDPPDAWIGIVASGYTYKEVREALRLLGLRHDADIAAAGIRLLQLRMPIPVDAGIVRQFARGLAEVFVVEEKNPTLEWFVKDDLYAEAVRPVVVGKRDERGAVLVPSTGSVTADVVLEPLHRRLSQRLGPDRLAPLPGANRKRIPVAAISAHATPVVPGTHGAPVARTPYFCSGCPHNWSTKVPDGALAGVGIGCHGMTASMEPARVGQLGGLSCMGNEGAQWVGMAPFVDRKHFFQNLGDGTYFHSGSLAIRFAIAANANITYKLLYNGTVAMTGGQHPQGQLDVPTLTQILLLEGVKRVLITTDDVEKYDDIRLPRGVDVWDRTRILEAQEVLAAIEGVTVLIHDQACAAEKRRARKRGKLAPPTTRVVINERVCEGCGHCGDVSNCLSVQPVDTEYGRKTRIHQTSCNLDYSCLNGDCPSFATVTVDASVARERPPLPPFDASALPEPHLIVPADDFTVRMPGIGGTGVVTVSQVLGTAALIDGKSVRGLDQTGLSQKAGPVVSDLRISTDEPHASNKATVGAVDLFLALDLLVATSAANLEGASAERTVVVGSTSPTPTGAMVVHPEIAYPTPVELRGRFDDVSRVGDNQWLDGAAIAETLFGDATMANVVMLGAAYQAGTVPVSAGAIERAIELNGVAVERNLAAFRWGRRAVAEPAAVDQLARTNVVPSRTSPVTIPAKLGRRIDAITRDGSLQALISDRVRELIAFQSVGYAGRYLGTLEPVGERERAVTGSETAGLTRAVAFHLHKLMAYKDEYEVARLLLLPEADDALARVGGPGAKATWKLHPPLLRAMGMKKKLSLGPWARPLFVALAKGRRLRGTPFDVMGRTVVRRLERAMIPEYEAAVRVLLERLGSENHAEAVRIASLPDKVRGYEHIKERRAESYRAELASALAAWRRAG